jgi:hypothetical protein
LDRLPHDREIEAVIREVLRLFRRNSGHWISGEDVRTRIPNTVRADLVLETLAECEVLESEAGPPRYQYVKDPLIEIEMQRYLRRAEHRDQNIQTNLARFRNRYNSP